MGKYNPKISGAAYRILWIDLLQVLNLNILHSHAEFITEILGKFPIRACSINLSARLTIILKDLARPSGFLQECTK
jgi:hypothetical protein